MSGQPSPSKSAQTTPRPGPGRRAKPDFSVTSSKHGTRAGSCLLAPGSVLRLRSVPRLRKSFVTVPEKLRRAEIGLAAGSAHGMAGS